MSTTLSTRPPITVADLARGSLMWDSKAREWYIRPFSRWRTDFILPRKA